ncbi:mediator of RNA polymerase ii transcription subunit 24 [Plakobranchus ocellatus]|uniref:Mediator of RNA polymerase ii transcription subunit 24 n=1 Tax=Plakobranchus ocellatus TaxID=259542 RepID=A0AAV4D1J6_9GAST|nr:mediator of RNA polymerase ii transcription subunit 24 [Plakobranchus ocellatus]
MSSLSENTTQATETQLEKAPESENLRAENAATLYDTASTPLQDQEASGAMACTDDKPSGTLSNLANDCQMMDRLMQRMKSDLMFELRHLQHGDRPVTGQGHRDSLHQFMLKHCDGQRLNGSPANVDAVEEHRPEAVVVEVQGMIESRPVSSVLQSPAFRRQLENVIRGGLVNARRNRPVAATTAASRRETPQQQHQQMIERGNESLPNSPTRRVQEPKPANIGSALLQRSDSTESMDSFSSARSHADQELENYDSEDIYEEEFEMNPMAAAVTTQEPSTSASSTESPSFPQPRPRSVFINRPTSPDPSSEDSHLNDSPNERDGLSWNDIGHIQREEMVQEISELLHSRLVSSTLESEFRATLELLAQEHVQASGHNGQAVQDFVQSLPGRGIPRNDFTHMNIPSNGAVAVDAESEDSVSVISVNAHPVPYVQTNTYLGREIQSLRKQMTEMKSMLKLTFDLQMDIQRSIRQEVAAALNNFAGANGAMSMPSTPSRPVNDTHCLICLDYPSDTVLYQCGHMCVCYKCGRDLISRGHSCPVCRAPIKDVIRAYKTNVE